MNALNHHPTDDAIQRWVTGEMLGEPAEILEGHVAACSVCSTRLADEAALEIVMQAAAGLRDEGLEIEDTYVTEGVAPVGDPPPATPLHVCEPATHAGWRQGFAVAAGFALLLLTGRGSVGEDHVDAIEPAAGGATRVVIGYTPASWEDGPTSEDIACVPLSTDARAHDDEPTCADPTPYTGTLLAMVTPSDPTPWSIPVTESNEDAPCTTPVDMGDSSTCDDWLSADDLSG